MSKRHQVFVSSTFEDLRDQRRKVWETLVSFDYIVVGMETFPATNDEQFEYIKKQILSSDYYVLIVAARYGSLTDEQISFTEKEFNFATQSEIPILVFPIEDPDSVAVANTDKDDTKAAKLVAFRKKATSKRIVQTWRSSDDLALGIIKSLKNAETAFPRPGWIRGGSPDNEALLGEIRELRLENDKLKKQAIKSASATTLADLEQEVSFEYTVGKSAKTNKAAIRLIDIVSELKLTETPTHDVITECIRGAIAVKTGKKFEDVAVSNDETDKATLLLTAHKIISLERYFGDMRIVHGSNWARVHALVRLPPSSSLICK